MNLPGVIEFWQELLSGPNVRYLPLLGLERW